MDWICFVCCRDWLACHCDRWPRDPYLCRWPIEWNSPNIDWLLRVSVFRRHSMFLLGSVVRWSTVVGTRHNTISFVGDVCRGNDHRACRSGRLCRTDSFVDSIDWRRDSLRRRFSRDVRWNRLLSSSLPMDPNANDTCENSASSTTKENEVETNVSWWSIWTAKNCYSSYWSVEDESREYAVSHHLHCWWRSSGYSWFSLLAFRMKISERSERKAAGFTFQTRSSMFVMVEFDTGRFLSDEFMRVGGYFDITGEQCLGLKSNRALDLPPFLASVVLWMDQLSPIDLYYCHFLNFHRLSTKMIERRNQSNEDSLYFSGESFDKNSHE